MRHAFVFRAGLALGCVALALAIGACPDPETEVVDKTAAEHGAELFQDPTLTGVERNTFSCATCHAAHADDAGDTILAGAPLAGATLRPSYWGGKELTLLGAVNDCRYYFMLADTPWAGDETEAEAIYAYLESLEDGGDATAQPFTIAPIVNPEAGDATRGAGVYENACASCHGAKSTGAGALADTAPKLPDATLAAHPSPDYSDEDRRLVFVEKTRHGTFFGYGGQMPPFSEELLSDQDLADLLTYLGVP
ncbi:MAG: c-type cytochrome [Polyangiaceae bacterium]